MYKVRSEARDSTKLCLGLGLGIVLGLVLELMVGL
jgi:hypothetical protein